MTTNPYAEAVEAAVRAIDSRASCEHERAWIDVPALRYENCFDCDGRVAVAAAVGPLLAPLREFVVTYRSIGSVYVDRALDVLTDTLDAIEAGATSEGARDE